MEILKYLNHEDLYSKDETEIKIPNDMRNGRLYAFCKYDMKDEAKKYGLRWDNSVKLWYIPHNMKLDNIEKLLSLECALYGRNTAIGYMDYKYSITVPKLLIYDTEKDKLILNQGYKSNYDNQTIHNMIVQCDPFKGLSLVVKQPTIHKNNISKNIFNGV